MNKDKEKKELTISSNFKSKLDSTNFQKEKTKSLTQLIMRKRIFKLQKNFKTKFF